MCSSDLDDEREQPTNGAGDAPAIVTLAGASQGSASPFPDLRGLGARDALRALTQLGLTARMHGDGVVVQQEPAPGGIVERGGQATLWLKRQSLRASRANEPEP